MVKMAHRIKNKQLTVWLARDVHADFVAWLKINSVGANTAERLRQLIYKILKSGV